MAIDLQNLTIKKAQAGLRAGEFTAVELATAYLNKIETENPNLNAYLEVFADVLDQAKAADDLIKAGGEVPPLAGIPLAIKDNILIKDRTASSASKILANYHATYDATVISKLKEQGAVFLGRTNMDEFAMGGSTENSAFGPTKNPKDPSRVPGGSSGGSAAVVGGDLALASLGTDTGGSIRQPASFCGVVGLKPTYGAVSRFGAMAMASSLDQIGPIAKTVEDTKIVFDAIRGYDKNDSTSSDFPFEALPALKKKIGVPRSFFGEGLDPRVLKNFDETLEKFKQLGYEIVDIDLSVLKYALAVYYIIMSAEVSTNLARFDGMRYGAHKDGANLLEDYLKSRGEGFGAEARRRIMLGTYVLSAGYYEAYYNKATKVRRLITEAYSKVFAEVDVVVTPTAPTPAFKIGEKASDPLQMYLEDIFTVPANLVGIPAISIPSGQTEDGLPFGIQLAAPHFYEERLFDIGRELENIN